MFSNIIITLDTEPSVGQPMNQGLILNLHKEQEVDFNKNRNILRRNDQDPIVRAVTGHRVEL